MDTRIKKVGTRENVYKGLAVRTAGGLKKDDIIAKQFGTRTLYISKKLSERMRENFNIIRSNNPTHFKRKIKKTLVVCPTENNLENNFIESKIINNKHQDILEQKKKQHVKTQKLSFKINDNTVKNVYYKELKGMDLQELKSELAREEEEEDLGQSPIENKEFSIEEMPDIDLASIQ
jgi:hypothetical protein